MAKSAVVPKAAAVAAPEEKAGSTRYKGVTTGMRVHEYQNQSLEQNLKRKVTDEVLAAEWHAEFPEAMDFTARVGMIQTVRGLYNKGKHKNAEPDIPLVAYDENKKPLPAPTRGRKKAEADEAAAPAAKAAPAAAPAKLKLKKSA